MSLPDMSWTDRALCAEVDPELFFPPKGGSTLAPKRICRACEVREECLAWAMRTPDQWGICGGLSMKQRARLGAPYTFGVWWGDKPRREAA